MTYYESIYALKNEKYFAKLYLLENNINLIKKTDKLFSIFKDVLNDIHNYYKSLNEDGGEETFFVED